MTFKNLEFLLLIPSVLWAQTVHEYTRGDEKELKVRIEYGVGKVYLSKGKPDQICRVESRPLEDKDYTEPNVDFESEGNTAYLNVSSDRDNDVNFFNESNQEMILNFTDKIPISYKMDFGACEGKLDFTNVRVKDLTLEMGASSMSVQFNAQNKESINKLKVEAGVSKLSMIGLSNANFERFDFEGGVGQYTLDFSGNLNQNAKAKISVGLGKMTIRIPKNLAICIRCESSFLTTFRIDNSYFERRGEDTYYSPDYDTASNRLDLTLEAGLGKMMVEVIP